MTASSAVAAALSEEDVSTAALSDEDASTAVLSDEDVSTAVLSDEDVSTAVLSEEDVSTAVLSEEDVSAAALSEEDVSAAALSDEDVSAAVLSEEDVSAAALSDEDVSAAVLSESISLFWSTETISSLSALFSFSCAETEKVRHAEVMIKAVNLKKDIDFSPQNPREFLQYKNAKSAPLKVYFNICFENTMGRVNSKPGIALKLTILSVQNPPSELFYSVYH